MTVILYLDVYFVVNLLMNLVLLCLVKHFLKLHAKRFRVMLAALAGASGACVIAVSGTVLSGIWRMVCTAAIFTAMAVIAYGRKRPAEFGKIFVGFSLVAAAAGGCFEAVSMENGSSFLRFLCCAAGVYFGGKALILIWRRKWDLQADLYDVVLHHQGKDVKVTALLDSGNRLYEPYGHQPVHVIHEAAVRQLCSTCRRVIYIPFSAVGTEYGMLPGIQIDAMEVKKDGILVKQIELPWLAISRQPLSPENRYEMLLHGEE